MMRHLILSLFAFSILIDSACANWYPDRRRDQFPTGDAYLVVPLPYSYPGIGEGFFLLGSASNIFDTTSDVVVIEVTGDATGRVGVFEEIPIITNELFLSIEFQDINRAVVNNYAIRGMNGSNGDDYTLLDITKADTSSFRLNYTLENRRINFYISQAEEEFALDAIRDPDGNLITQLTEPYTDSSKTNLIGFSIDYTDDYLDPRKGLRFGIELIDRPAKDQVNDPDYYVLNYNFLYYQPLSDADTLVINYYQSDAHVRTTGNTDENYYRTELNFNCGTDPICLQSEQELVDSFVNSATNGTSTSLGGLERLRSYPQSRFQGGHTGFLGVEYRWNLTDEATPFNYFFWKDVRTGKQIAFFAEAGSVSEKSSELWDEQRYTYGVGFRILAASGSVYRVDIASGDEGTEVAIFFYYPW